MGRSPWRCGLRHGLILAGVAFADALTIPITPIGPFCPFRSAACADGSALDQAMSGLSMTKMPKFAVEMSRLQLELQAGSTPDPGRVRQMADDICEAEVEWKTMMTRMQLTNDFQSREYYKLTSAWAERQGESLESVGVMMRWQADNMRAFANGQPPLPPPPGLDLAKLARQQQEAMQGGGPSPSVMDKISAAQAVDSTPFTGDEAAFESDVVKEEYRDLCRAHANLIQLGETFGTFDPLGKIAYLDALEAIQERWDVFFSRFALLGALNPTFKQQTEAFLNSMGMSSESFREVLREAHAQMRKDAEVERDQMGM